MIKSNCHTHTVFCDGNNTPEEMCHKAIKLNFKSLGFSFHSPLPYENDYAILESKLEEYYNEIERVKEKYKNEIQILNGIEFDNDSIGLVDISKYDYSIGSVHQMHINDKVYTVDYSAAASQECVDECFKGSWLSLAEHYYALVYDFISKVDYTIVGHFDLISKFNKDNAQFDEFSDEYLTIAKNCLDKIYKIKPNQVFEINTGAMYRCGNKSPYPNAEILKHMNKLGFKIMINSDSHSVSSLDFAFKEAQEYCVKCGYKEVNILTNNGFEKIKLN